MSDVTALKIYISSDSDLKKSIKDSEISGPIGTKKVSIHFIAKDDLKKLQKPYVLFDRDYVVK